MALLGETTDNDGDLDLAVGNEHSPPQNELYTNCIEDHEYLRFHLTGQFHAMGAGFSNRDGIGVKIYLYDSRYLGSPTHHRESPTSSRAIGSNFESGSAFSQSMSVCRERSG